MTLIPLTIGFLLFLLGWGYLFYPNLILRLNEFARETLFKDSKVILAHRRIGMTVMLIGFILMAMSVRHG